MGSVNSLNFDEPQAIVQISEVDSLIDIKLTIIRRLPETYMSNCENTFSKMRKSIFSSEKCKNTRTPMNAWSAIKVTVITRNYETKGANARFSLYQYVIHCHGAFFLIFSKNTRRNCRQIKVRPELLNLQCEY